MATTHTDTEVHGFNVTATIHTDPAYRTGPMVWLGIGCEGRHLTPEEAEELAGALFGATATLRAQASSQAAAV